jgi:hypothetical protein
MISLLLAAMLDFTSVTSKCAVQLDEVRVGPIDCRVASYKLGDQRHVVFNVSGIEYSFTGVDFIGDTMSVSHISITTNGRTSTTRAARRSFCKLETGFVSCSAKGRDVSFSLDTMATRE